MLPRCFGVLAARSSAPLRLMAVAQRGLATASPAARSSTPLSQRLAGLSGALAVAAGAAGAHALPKRHREMGLSEEDQKTYSEIFQTASRYHMLHAVLLVAAPMARFPLATSGLLVSGKLLFVGSLYAIAAAGDRKIDVAKAAPVGGGLLILGWLSFAL